MNNYIKYALFAMINFVFVLAGFSQTAAATPASSDFNISINTALACIAVILLFIIIMLTVTVNQAVDFYKQKNDDAKKDNGTNIKPIAILLGLLAISQVVFSQETAAAATPVVDNSAQHAASIYMYSFIILILVEVAVILFLLKSIRFLTGIEKQQSLKSANSSADSFWSKINNLKPIEEEASLDTGHSYDGIRELDNITPPWFTAAFIATIIFAIVYVYRYEVAHSAPDQIEEFQTEMHNAKLVQDSLLKLEGNKIDENSVVLLTGGDVDAGKSTFMSNCSACHGDKGQGGVGPNLTDEYWIHGGSLGDVFKSIKYGWVEKGMKSWKDDFSPKQIAQLTSYIKTLKGTNPSNAKEKQGELYVESAITTVTVADSTTKETSKK